MDQQKPGCNAWQLASTYKVLCLVVLEKLPGSGFHTSAVFAYSKLALMPCTLVLTTLWPPCQRDLTVKPPAAS